MQENKEHFQNRINGYTEVLQKHMQDKKHILITGDRGSGKSTLLQRLITMPGMEGHIDGLLTWCERGKAVYMGMAGTDDEIMVGRFNPDITTKENRMSPVPEGFNGYGVSALEKFMQGETAWIYIDEIGYLESACKEYTETVKRLLDKKRVIAVVRKQDTEFIQSLFRREDVYVMDLDDEIDM